MFQIATTVATATEIAEKSSCVQWNPITTSDIIQIVYVIATLVLLAFAVITAIFNRRQITATVAGLKQSQEQFDAIKRAKIVVYVSYIRSMACLTIKNIGHNTALNVNVTIPQNFLERLSQLDSDDNINKIKMKEIRKIFFSQPKVVCESMSYSMILWKKDNYQKIIEEYKTLEVKLSYSDNFFNLYSEDITLQLYDEYLIESMPDERIALALENIAQKRLRLESNKTMEQ